MNEEYIDNVKHLIEQKDADKVKGLLIDLHPADIAELCNDLNAEEAKFVYRLLDNEIAADVLVEMDEDARKELLEMLPSETIAKRFVDYMDTDDAVDLMRELDEDKQEEVLSHIEDIEQAGDIVDLLKYDENTSSMGVSTCTEIGSFCITCFTLANSSLDAKNTFKQITKESVVALINATIISLLVYTYNITTANRLMDTE